MHKNREKNAMRREVNRADIGGKSGNKVKDCHVTIIRSLLSQIKENSLRVLLTYRKLFTINTKIAVEFIINSCIVYYKRSPHLLVAASSLSPVHIDADLHMIPFVFCYNVTLFFSVRLR